MTTICANCTKHIGMVFCDEDKAKPIDLVTGKRKSVLCRDVNDGACKYFDAIKRQQ